LFGATALDSNEPGAILAGKWSSGRPSSEATELMGDLCRLQASEPAVRLPALPMRASLT